MLQIDEIIERGTFDTKEDLDKHLCEIKSMPANIISYSITSTNYDQLEFKISYQPLIRINTA